MSNHMYENMLWLTALKNKHAAQDAYADIAGWQDAYNQAQADIDKLLKAIEQRDQVIAQYKEQLAVKSASAEASGVVWDSYSDNHPDSPLRKVIGTRKDGKPLTKARQIWIETFDRIARELGIKNPEKHRVG